MDDTTDPMVLALRAWAAEGEPAHVRAALELLIKQGWLRRRDFTRACVSAYTSGGESVTCIDWQKARAFLARAPIGSTTELAILDLAVILAHDRFRLANMGHVHRQRIAHAVAQAAGLEGRVADAGGSPGEGGARWTPM